MALQALISDIDGTLIDTIQVIERGMYGAASQHLIEVGVLADDMPTFEQYRTQLLTVIGGRVRETLESTNRLIFNDRPDVLELLDFDRMTEIMKPIQEELALSHVKAYDGLDELFTHLGHGNIGLGLFTSGGPHHVVRNMVVALPQLGLHDLYDDESMSYQQKLEFLMERIRAHYHITNLAITTVDDVSASKPDPECVYSILNKLGFEANSVAALGDHIVDMQATQLAGVPVRIGITHGFDDEEVLRSQGATHIAHTLKDVVHLISQYGDSKRQ